MSTYTMTPEVVRVTIVVGVILSIVFYERVQLTTGGAIVPAYLAIAVVRPIAVIVTVGAGYLTHLLVTQVITKRRILYGRRKFEVEVLLGLAIITSFTLSAHFLGRLDPTLLAFAGIGFLIPGIIAHDMGRQTPKRTIAAIGITTSILAVFAYVVSSLVSIVPGASTTSAALLSSRLGYPRELLLVAVGVSVLVGMFVYDRIGLRSGGFITGAYLALVSPRWGDLVFTLVIALATWFVVVRILMPRLLLFGRRKVSTMMLVGAVIGWSGELILALVTHREYTPWLGLTVATLMVPALIANDAQRQGWERTIWGTTLVGVGVFAVTNLIAVPLELGGLL